jgi:hypothetical protein
VAKCDFCGDEGFTSKSPNQCPYCGRKRGATKVADNVDIQVVLDEAGVFVPEDYRNIEFDATRLRNNKRELAENGGFDRYVNTMNKIYNEVRDGIIPNKSVLLYAPQNFGKQSWVYATLQAGIKAGMRTIPFMDLHEAKRIIEACEQRSFRDPILKQYGVLDADIYDADLCILKVPVGNRYLEAYQQIVSILDRRGRRSKKTIITSRYSLKALSEPDKFNDLQSCLNQDYQKSKNIIYVPYRAER